MIPQNHDPLREALAGDRLISLDVIFGKIAIWVFKIGAIGITGVFTWSLISNSLPKDASSLMIAFAGVGAFMLEACFLIATIWIRISRNGLQTALAWIIFGFSLFFLLVNVLAGAILAESKQATLGKGWIELYLVIMPATGVLCSVLVVLWSLASPEASNARRNSIASGLVSQRYEAARLRTALHDVSLNEVVDQAASRDAWNTVSRNLGLPAPQQGIPALPAPAQPVYYYPQPQQQPQVYARQPQQPQQYQQPVAGSSQQPVTSASSNQAYATQQHEQAYYPHNLSLVSTTTANPAAHQPAQSQHGRAVAPVQPESASTGGQSGAGLGSSLLDLPGVKKLLAAYAAKNRENKAASSHAQPASAAAPAQHFAADSGLVEPSNPQPEPETESDGNANQHQGYPKNS